MLFHTITQGAEVAGKKWDASCSRSPETLILLLAKERGGSNKIALNVDINLLTLHINIQSPKHKQYLSPFP